MDNRTAVQFHRAREWLDRRVSYSKSLSESYNKGITACTSFEFTLSFPLLSTAVTT